ncbi:MAG TPA: hypothetical protein VN224_02975, partial [Xanthomonadales bacterium]|nr:hypothetical protein [Xanthomonadales bacterium]
MKRRLLVVLALVLGTSVSCSGTKNGSGSLAPAPSRPAADGARFSVPPPNLSAVPPPPPSLKAPARPPANARRALATTPHPAFFAGEVSVGTTGDYYLQFADGTVFGYYYYVATSNMIYHYDMGFESYSDANDSDHGIYFYDFQSGHWMYTSPSASWFPYLYDFWYAGSLFYYVDTTRAGHYTTAPRYFYNFRYGRIITLPEASAPVVWQTTANQTWPWRTELGNGQCGSPT